MPATQDLMQCSMLQVCGSYSDHIWLAANLFMASSEDSIRQGRLAVLPIRIQTDPIGVCLDTLACDNWHIPASLIDWHHITGSQSAYLVC